MELEQALSQAAAISTLICFISPLIASIGFYRDGTTGSTASLPLVSTFVSSLFWLVYALLSVNQMLIRINAFSLGLFAIYLAIYYAYCPNPARLYRELRLATTFSLVYFPALVVLSRTDSHLAMVLMGTVCNCLTIGVYASPLGTLMEVIRDQNTSSLSPPLIYASTFSALVWVSYGFVINDIFILIPNIIGAILCASQCVLLLLYPRSSAKTKTS